MTPHWKPEYQERDQDLVDYHEFYVRDCEIPFRGPGFDPFAAESGSYFSCLGAAQTYGCYFDKPFPALLSEAIGMPALNLAVGGGTAGFYLQYESLIEAINRGRFVILQAMAARQESNSRVTANGYVEFVTERATGETITSSEAWNRIIREEPENAVRYVEEVRASWLETTRQLLEHITVPVVFFWFSQRERDYEIDHDAIARQLAARREGKDQSYFLDGLSSGFPHYIDGPTARAAAALCDVEAECLSSRGMGQTLIDRFTGEPAKILSAEGKGPDWHARITNVNSYYPSAEMHEDAAAALVPVVQKLLKRS